MTMRKLKTLEMHRMTVDEFKESPKLPLVAVLDDVRSLHNVGSVFRTGDAFRIEGVWLCGITATPPMQEIHKTALGAEDSVDWKYFPSATDAVKELHALGYMVCAVEQCEGSTMLHRFEPMGNEGKRYSERHEPSDSSATTGTSPKGWAVVLGNEVKGVHQEVVDMCDACLEIPQYGTKHSLNVSVTAGIVLWEFAKKLLSAQP